MSKLTKPLLLLVLLGMFQAQAAEKYITIDSSSMDFTQKTFGERVQKQDELDGISLIKIDEDALPWLSMMMHREFKRCGGFMMHDSAEEARESLNNASDRSWASKSIFADYSINQEDTVRSLIPNVRAGKIAQVIEKLSSYHNRYYKAQTGVDAAKWIRDHWASLVAHRNDARAELYQHRGWPQPSVILTIDGKSDETIVIGGHLDSIAGFFGGSRSRAPGADDNASGIATITEIVRVLMEGNYVPEKTLKFMGYAAEEVGLRGSKEIARDMKSKGANIVGVMQLDMTNFKGTEEQDIVMMTDYTNAEQNAFIGTLIDSYLPGINWGYDKCGYACSDHASWHGQGFPASMPFESRKGDMNGNIHTARDTISQSRGNANHASNFAKMAVAFIVELDR